MLSDGTSDSSIPTVRISGDSTFSIGYTIDQLTLVALNRIVSPRPFLALALRRLLALEMLLQQMPNQSGCARAAVAFGVKLGLERSRNLD